MIYVFWTCKDEREAKTIIHGLLDQHLIACASIFPQITSIYRWEGKIEESQEVKIMLKSQKKHFDAIQNYIQQQCSYEVPEILQIDITQGNLKYLDWVKQETNNCGKIR